ncbi:hypothetical protein AC579_4537 [Pseudocercospora musae]|uniref:Uncharacterized protein n=1 Tax=Pseudocercospora musae TaxID=113226 RepID=A0A139ITT4_9PEZI|nr:hypothetical protein AC579_4537 [Pseudocercospora musae]
MPKLLDPPTSATNRTDALVVDTTRSLTWYVLVALRARKHVVVGLPKDNESPSDTGKEHNKGAICGGEIKWR